MHGRIQKGRGEGEGGQLRREGEGRREQGGERKREKREEKGREKTF